MTGGGGGERKGGVGVGWREGGERDSAPRGLF